MRYEIAIQAGTLLIDTRREDLPLDNLLTFASRQNPRRGYLFVSRVLGKHIPCRPSLMRNIYDRLAEKLRPLPGPVVVIGMAETAIALGFGVADSLSECYPDGEILAIHTTRYRLPLPVLASFDENHSHAPDHILYRPQGERAELFEAAASLVLVDDEISTGRTLELLAGRAAVHMPRLRQIVLVSIVNWLSLFQCQVLTRRLARPVRFVSLLEGGFEFTPDPAYRPVLPTGITGHRRYHCPRMDTGRAGLIVPAERQRWAARSVPDGPLVVVGTGEFTFAPFLAAETLEQEGRDVLFQSTTRSPIAEGPAIRRKLTFADEHNEGVTNYIYNLPLDRRVVVAYEHSDNAAAHAFPAMVDARVWTLAGP